MKILFLCTANSCRSILAEALFNHMAPEGMCAFSAGSEPKGRLNPRALATLERAGISIAGLESVGVDAHEQLRPDIVITVCDNAAGEACPVFFGAAIIGHWGLADPSDLEGDDKQLESAFDETLKCLRRRITAFLEAHPQKLAPKQIKAELARIGEL